MVRTTYANILASTGLYFSMLQFSVMAGPVDTQMQYSGSVEIVSKTSVTIVTVSAQGPVEEHPALNVNDIWPTSSVPGMNLEQLLSYEMGHNFELRPSTSYFNPTKSSSTVTTTTLVYLPPQHLITSAPSLFPRKADVLDLIAPQVTENQPSQAVMNIKECQGLDLNPLYKKRGIALITPPAPTDPAASHASYAAMIYSMAAPYLPQNNRVSALRARAAGANLPPQDPNAPYGALVSTSDFALYTDKQAWDQAVYTWGQQGQSATCLGHPPLFVATTKKAATPTPPPGAVTTTPAQPKVVGQTKDKKMTNANGGIRFAKPVGDTTIGKREEGATRTVDVSVSGPEGTGMGYAGLRLS